MTELDYEMDDLIMRLKDCISHEDNHVFGDRCITKVKFKQQMKALIDKREREILKVALTVLPNVEYFKLKSALSDKHSSKEDV